MPGFLFLMQTGYFISLLPSLLPRAAKAGERYADISCVLMGPSDIPDRSFEK
jgi:hypothetical protein